MKLSSPTIKVFLVGLLIVAAFLGYRYMQLKENAIEITPINQENINEVPETILEEIETLKKGTGYYSFDNELHDTEFDYLLVSFGEKPTGGYELKFNTIELIDGTLSFTIKEVTPDNEGVVTTALTYPYSLMRLDKEYNNIEVTTVSGKIYQTIDPTQFEETPDTTTVDAIYIGLQDAHTVSLKVDEKEISLQLATGISVDEFENGDEVTAEYVENAQGQLLLTSIIK